MYTFLTVTSPTAALLPMETAITTITSAMPNIFTLVTTVLTEVLGNPILVLPMAIGFIGMGIGVYKMLRSAV